MDDAHIGDLSRQVGACLKARGWMIATAESCTGGWVAQAITAVAGSSEWFERGFVTYSNASKQELLGVPGETLARHGAVSEETAQAMASGALAHSRADLAISVTGIAGPGGGSAHRPVGTVCFGIAWAGRLGEVKRSERLLFSGDREAIRRQSVAHALQWVIGSLDGADSEV